MGILERDLSDAMTQLQKSLERLEKRLIESGFESETAGEWIFHIRDIVGDWRQRLLELVIICDSPDTNEIPSKLDGFKNSILYQTNPHNDWHMQRFEQLLEKVLPSDEEDNGDNLADGTQENR